MAARKCGSFFANHSILAFFQNGEVCNEARLLNSLSVGLFYEGPSEEYVSSNGVSEDDGLLLDIGNTPFDTEHSGVKGEFSQDGIEEATLSWAHFSSDSIEHAFTHK